MKSNSETVNKKPKLAVWKFASCDGCQLSLLDCEDQLLLVADNIEIAVFAEATRTVVEGPYDISLVEGSITTAHDQQKIQEIRAKSKFLITIGACATAGGIQALRNFIKVEDYVSLVYAHPEYIKTLDQSTPISSHVKVDFELQGCPINKMQLLEVLSAYLQNRSPNIPSYSVCIECKRKNNICIMVAHGTPCMGPLTHAGCDAICPSYNRGCYSCYGPKETAHPLSWKQWAIDNFGETDENINKKFKTFYNQPYQDLLERQDREKVKAIKGSDK
ncbi:MAG: NADH-quinone oxidoreductase subunit B family protein [Pseudobdellovibrionaceae bacterium]